MTPAWKQRLRRDAAACGRWRAADPLLSKRIGGVPQLQPWSAVPLPHSDTTPPATRSYRPPPFPVFHTRHAEESAERPRLVTVVRPCSHSVLRKVTVLLNRRGVVSYEQLLLDISEALGFPRWHRARVTRLYTPHAREVQGVCDFFRGEVAFLALGKSRPELQSVKEALEELFPEHSRYCDDALRAWERKLHPPPDKAAKADSGYSEGPDAHTHPNTNTHTHLNTDTQANLNANTHTHLNTDTQANLNTHTQSNTRRHTDTHTQAVDLDTRRDTHRRADTHPNQHPSHRPNHLQRVRVKDLTRQRLSLPIGPLTQDKEVGGKIETPPPPPRCRNCRLSEQPTPRAGRIRLPPVARKPTGNRTNNQVIETPYAGLAYRHARPPGRVKEETISQSECSSDSRQEKVETKQEVIFDLPSDDSVVTLSDIERCYDIGRIVGDGNFAVVRECRRHDNREHFAVKIVEHSKLIGREHMMQNELSLMGSLSHPRVVRLLAHHHTHTHSYLVMEMVAGGDLFEAISEHGKYPEEEAGLMVRDVSDALTYIHSKSIVHRDLKPENLLVECITDGVTRLKLGDFGLAMVVTEPVFTVCGTPTYVAPEILSETGYGLPVDLWALGVILYILLCGFPPFRSKNRDQEELFQLVREGQLSFLSPYWDDISDGAQSLVRALLKVDPTERLTAAQTLKHPWIQNKSNQHRPPQINEGQQTPLETRTTSTSKDHYRPADPIIDRRRPALNQAEPSDPTLPGQQKPAQNQAEHNRPVQSPTLTHQQKLAQPSKDQHTVLQTSREIHNHPHNSYRPPQTTDCLPQHEPPSTSTFNPPPSTQPAPPPQPFTQPAPSPQPSTQPAPPSQPFTQPAPSPQPSTQPAPPSQPFTQPAPSPQPSTQPTPSPQPFTQPAPPPQPFTQPAPSQPFTQPASPPQPFTQPAPSPQPFTQPAPSPQPSTQPAPSPQPSTQPAPSPQTSTQPAPSPQPSTQPAPPPQPSTQPAPSPQPSTQPAHSPQPSTQPAPSEMHVW